MTKFIYTGVDSCRSMVKRFYQMSPQVAVVIIAFESDRTKADFRFKSLFFEYLC